MAAAAVSQSTTLGTRIRRWGLVLIKYNDYVRLAVVGTDLLWEKNTAG